MTTKGIDLWNPDSIDRKKVSALALQTRRDFRLLETEIDGLYEEFDKLTKKAPANRVTDLALENVNSAIGDAKTLLAGDRYFDRIQPFVAAGENPVNSDALLTLAKLKAALDRFERVWGSTWNDYDVRYSF